ncbi:MAG: hypothetical protein RLZZ252_940 [Bacteroidota bacterium]
MVNQGEAISKLTTLSIDKEIVELPLVESLGYILATDVVAPMDVPSFDNSAMDGYAVCWENEIPEKFILCGIIAAGDHWSTPLKHGEAIRIFTGASVPVGCVSVIQQEWAIETEKWVTFTQPIQANLNIRKKGSQTKINQTVVSAGQKITSGIIGLLATLGITQVSVINKAIISIIITGNELVEIGQALPEAKIFNSNGPMLQALFAEKKIKTLPYSRCMDDPQALKSCILSAMKESNVIVLTGGISVGDFDYVKTVLEDIGVIEVFYKVKQKPGKPLFIGLLNNQIFIALPGNPASVNSCFHAWVNPLIQQINGGITVGEYYEQLPIGELANSYQKKIGLTHFVKGNVNHGKITILTGQESFNLSTLNVANALVILPENWESNASGISLKYIPF